MRHRKAQVVCSCALALVAAAAVGCSDASADPSTRDPVPTTIELVNESEQAIAVQTRDCNGRPRWFEMTSDAQEVAIHGACGGQDCRSFDESLGGVGCAAVCQEDEFDVLEPGESIAFPWDGAQWVPHETKACSMRLALEADSPLSLEFCWHVGGVVTDAFGTAPMSDVATCGTRAEAYGSAAIRFAVQ